MKSLVRVILTIILGITLIKPTYAQEQKVPIHVFWQLGCPHCKSEIAFLREFTKTHPSAELKLYEVSKSYKNAKLFSQVGDALDARTGGVPFTVVGSNYFVGWPYENTSETVSYFEELVSAAKAQEDVVNTIAGTPKEPEPPKEPGRLPDTVKIPFFGELALKNVSIPTLTVALALADGFNPCAMWVLVFLISMLLGIKDKKRMWLIGGTFILVSGLVYFLFLTAWLNFFLFIGFIRWVRIIIGITALVAGYKYLKDSLIHKEMVCEVTSGNINRKRTFEKLRGFVLEKNLLVSLLGVAGMAFAVNLVELFCSAGLPAVYTQTLTLANLPTWQYYIYMLVYVVIFMFDDTAVFVAAMITLKTTGLQGKYARLAHIVGGVLMAGLGLVMLFKPEWLLVG